MERQAHAAKKGKSWGLLMQVDLLESLKRRVWFGSVYSNCSWPQFQELLTTPMKLRESLILYSRFWTKDYHPIPWFLVQHQTFYGNSKHRRWTGEYSNGWGASRVVEVVTIPGDASQQWHAGVLWGRQWQLPLFLSPKTPASLGQSSVREIRLIWVSCNLPLSSGVASQQLAWRTDKGLDLPQSRRDNRPHWAWIHMSGWVQKDRALQANSL